MPREFSKSFPVATWIALEPRMGLEFGTRLTDTDDEIATAPMRGIPRLHHKGLFQTRASGEPQRRSYGTSSLTR